MALEPAGISLKIEGFNKYIKGLERIDQLHQDIFNVDSKPLTRAFKDAEKAAAKLNKELEGVDEETKTVSKKMIGFGTVLKTIVASAIVTQTKALAEGVFELGKMGASYQALRIGLNNLAASVGQSGDAIQNSIVKASRGAISNIDALQAANELLLLEVAKTPEEFEKVTKAAVILGRSVGIGATEALKRFTTALGRESELRLDDFGVKTLALNTEMDKLSRQKMGKLVNELTRAERSAVFLEAAFKVVGEDVAVIGDNAGDALESFNRLESSTKNLKTSFGEFASNINQAFGITDKLANALNKLSRDLTIDIGKTGKATLTQRILGTRAEIEKAEEFIKTLQRGRSGFDKFLAGILGFDERDRKALEKTERKLVELKNTLNELEIRKAAEDAKILGDNFDGLEDSVGLNIDALRAYEQAVKRALNLQLQFARAAEDEARNRARDEEDIIRRRTRENEDLIRRSNRRTNKLNERQANERENLLAEQQKKLDKFERNRLSRIAEAETKAAKERKKAAEERIKAQEDLFRRLRQAEERFRLSQLQGERRFLLEDRRLRAEGDILGLQELRENRALQVREDKENFDLSQRQTKENAREEEKERDKEFNAEQRDRENKLKELKDDLDRQREELLIGFDEQLKAQEKSQADQRAELQRTLAERREDKRIAVQREEEDRRIALEREEEDRRISQNRQLEDLGRSLANQKDVTEQGVKAIASEIEKIFGQDGVADTIFKGFSDRSESGFKDLFDNIEDIVKGTEKEIKNKTDPLLLPINTKPSGKIHQVPNDFFTKPSGKIHQVPNDFFIKPSGKIHQVPNDFFNSFDKGGVVPGPVGSPRIIQAHGGETILPTHKQSFTMNAPVIPAQNLNVNMSGGFNISGGEQAGEQAVQAAITEMTDSLEIAIKRIARRN